MYYVMDAHSFYNFIYFILLIIVSTSFLPLLNNNLTLNRKVAENTLFVKEQDNKLKQQQKSFFATMLNDFAQICLNNGLLIELLIIKQAGL